MSFLTSRGRVSSAHGRLPDMPGDTQPKTGPASMRPSSWPGMFGNSVESGSVLAFVRRAVGGHRQSSPEAGVTPGKSGQKSSLAEVRQQLMAVLEDCLSDVVRWHTEGQVLSATSVMDLWLTRCDIYQCVAREKGQGEASRRINGLMPLFEGWIPARQLTPV